jgi:hypothetical protein
MNVSEIHLQFQTVRRKSHLSIKSQESLMQLVCDTSLKIKFESLPLPDFWIYIQNKQVCGTLATCRRRIKCKEVYVAKNSFYI